LDPDVSAKQLPERLNDNSMAINNRFDELLAKRFLQDLHSSPVISSCHNNTFVIVHLLL